MIDRREVNAPHGKVRAQARKELADPVVPEVVRREKAVMKALIRDVAEVHGHLVIAMIGMPQARAGLLANALLLGRRDRPAPPDLKVHLEEMIGEAHPEVTIREGRLEVMIGGVLLEATIEEVPQEVMIGGVLLEVMIGEVPPERMIEGGRPEGQVGTTAEVLPPLEGHQSLGKHRAAMSAPSVREIR